MRKNIAEWWPACALLGAFLSCFVLMTTNLLFGTPESYIFIAAIVSGLVIAVGGIVEARVNPDAGDDVLAARLLFGACFIVPAVARLIGG